jgi:outer membrane protein OmpA-like peptidoglycan-associated protein
MFDGFERSERRHWIHRSRLGRKARLAGILLALVIGRGACAQTPFLPLGPGVFYFGGEGGWTALHSEKDRVPGKNFPEDWQGGFDAGARAGLQWGAWRVEEEFRYQDNGVSTFARHPVHGGRQGYAVMTNALYDFSLGGPLSPHIGGGIGAVDIRERVTAPILGLGVVSRGSDWEFAYQAIAGLRYEVTPSLALDLDYRYLAATTPHFRTPPGLIVDGAPAGNLTVTSGYATHSVVASLTLRFGPPLPVVVPPVPPAIRPVTRKMFLVFFDWDMDTITPEGMQITRQAAAAFRAGAPVTIQVTGYTDRSGSPGYNQRLSERRANNVANALARFGVPRSQMAVSGRGENDNRVPTADGVREPQNRRVEIVSP